MANVKDLIELLIKAEFALDNHNADYGTKDKYCLQCNAKEYDAIVGVVHSPNCLIIQIRSIVDKELKEVQ